ncbi:ABC transporter permease [Pseudovibrio sp. Tun.PSC04-5.I4]|uniref:ABC transporter permease n=1 Tax=Pseudovibrio sp. Tun.PSC04-5.I4 TaxID=1798213 RepID=UPI001FCBDE9B|nr:ABC transporter permease [Pseudovibrio sp. Tun.PSC04-5.I4]
MLLFALNGMFNANSVSFNGISGLFSTYLALMFLAVGQTFVVYAGDIDLSAGTILSLVNVVIITLMNQMGGDGASSLAIMGVGVLVGAVCGLFNGVLIAGLRLQAIVATFATSIFFTGIALYVLPVAGMPAPMIFWQTYFGSILGIPFVFYVVAMLCLLIFLVSRTQIVLRLLAVGDDKQATFQSGLPVTATRIGGYVLCGIFASFAAFCLTGDTASGDPLVGAAMTLSSVAAVVLGGSMLSGGFGTMLGSLFGALTIGLIGSLVYFAGTPASWQNLVQGLAILAALMIGILISRRS